MYARNPRLNDEQVDCGLASARGRSTANPRGSRTRWRDGPLFVALGIVLLWIVATPAMGACRLVEVAQLPVAMAGMDPMVSVQVNGKATWMLVDSGAVFGVLSPSRAAQLKLTARPGGIGSGLSGTFDFLITDVRQLQVGNLSLANVRFMIDPHLSTGATIGQDVLDRADVEYDLAHRVIHLKRPRHCGNASLAYWAGSQPVSILQVQLVLVGQQQVQNCGRPVCFGMGQPPIGALARAFGSGPSQTPLPSESFSVAEAATSSLAVGTGQLDGTNIRVLLDTGTPVSTLSLAAAKRAHINLRGAPVAGLLGGLEGHVMQSWIVPVAKLQIGGEEIRNAHVRTAPLELPGIDMVLGADFFLSHHVYVANSQHRVYFTYGGGPVFTPTPPAPGPTAGVPSAH